MNIGIAAVFTYISKNHVDKTVCIICIYLFQSVGNRPTFN